MEFTLLSFYKELVLKEALQNHLHMLKMFCLRPGENQNVWMVLTVRPKGITRYSTHNDLPGC